MADLMTKLKKGKWKRYINYIAVGVVALIFSLLSVAGSLPLSTLIMLEKITMNIVLAGGVSANSVLRSEVDKLSKEMGVELYYPELKLCGDNAAMIAAAGYYEYLRGNLSDSSLNASALDSIRTKG